MKLTEKQRRFAEAYIGEAKGNGAQAARLAGYKGTDQVLASVAHENLGKPHIRAHVDELLAKVRSDAIADAEEALAFLTGTMRGEECRKQLTTPDGRIVRDHAGEPVFEEADARDRVKAAELLLKVHGVFTEKIEVKAVDAVKAQLERLRKTMSPPAFAELLKALAAPAKTT